MDYDLNMSKHRLPGLRTRSSDFKDHNEYNQNPIEPKTTTHHIHGHLLICLDFVHMIVFSDLGCVGVCFLSGQM